MENTRFALFVFLYVSTDVSTDVQSISYTDLHSRLYIDIIKLQ